MQSVYLETSIISYLTSRPSRDLIAATRQEITRQWWEHCRNRFTCYISRFVAEEAGGGDPEAAEKRRAILAELPFLEPSEAVVEMAKALIRDGLLPEKAMTDALHLATATANEMDILMTWNCRHLANAELLGPILRRLRKDGYEPPLICTPDELTGDIL